MSEAEQAWVGAMVEAEGTVRPDGRIDVVNTDVEIISTLLRFTGTGNVYLHKRYTNKLCWYWTVFRQKDIEELHRQIGRWMTGKRRV